MTIPWRLASIPTNAMLEMYKLDERRPESDVTVQLQLPDNSRHSGSFKPSVSLDEMLDWYRKQPERFERARETNVRFVGFFFQCDFSI